MKADTVILSSDAELSEIENSSFALTSFMISFQEYINHLITIWRQWHCYPGHIVILEV